MSSKTFAAGAKLDQDAFERSESTVFKGDLHHATCDAEKHSRSFYGKPRSSVDQVKQWTSAGPNFRNRECSRRSFTFKRILLCTVVLVALLAWLAWIDITHFSPYSALVGSHSNTSLKSSLGVDQWIKPESIKIIGFMYYGRRRTVEILECYLRRNLVSNGGFLDEVRFIVNTDNPDDLDYLSDIVNKVDGYRKVVRDGSTERTTAYEDMLRLSITQDALMIKIDDDLVWMDTDTIPEMVTSLINHPEAFSVLANLINSAALGWLHHHRGAIHAFLPEQEAPISPRKDSYGSVAWKPSHLPMWQPKKSGQSTDVTHGKEGLPAHNASAVSKGGSPYPNHRWLPLRSHDMNIYETPIADTEYDPFSNDWKEWSIAAQQHYSLFENLEQKSVDKYTMGGDGIWNLRRMRGNINLVAFWANDIMDNLPFDDSGDDEHQLTVALPKKTRRECLVQTRALASHFSFYCQAGLFDTDLLSRYRAFANDNVCTFNNKIRT